MTRTGEQGAEPTAQLDGPSSGWRAAEDPNDTTSVLLVPVPEAEAATAGSRMRLDPTCHQGMPAHITVLVPFVPPTSIDGAVVGELERLFAQFGAFDFTLPKTSWFDDRVVYLAPDPAEPFRAMTSAVVERFPDFPPYQGAFSDTVPHLTIGEGGRWRKRRGRMRRAASRIESALPIEAQATEVWLMVLRARARRWDRVRAFSLS
jgi:2'-5' RNA ligase